MEPQTKCTRYTVVSCSKPVLPPPAPIKVCPPPKYCPAPVSTPIVVQACPPPNPPPKYCFVPVSNPIVVPVCPPPRPPPPPTPQIECSPIQHVTEILEYEEPVSVPPPPIPFHEQTSKKSF